MPKGDRGLQTDRGLLLGEEPHILQISGPRLLCLWRTELGFLDSRYRDGKKGWALGCIVGFL